MFKKILGALNSVKTIDTQFDKLTKTTNQIKINQLLSKIDDKPEINTLVVKFLKDLRSVGISQSSDRQNKAAFYLNMWKFRQLHHIIWDLCAVHDISQHSHRLKWDINDIGVLDPKNFPKQYYVENIETENSIGDKVIQGIAEDK